MVVRADEDVQTKKCHEKGAIHTVNINHYFFLQTHHSAITISCLFLNTQNFNTLLVKSLLNPT